MPPPAVFAEAACIEEFNESCRIFAEPNKYKAEIAAFEFKAYAEPHRKAPVRDLCFGKCAYCESYYAATARGDVEHYRPKGAISQNGKRKKERGYFWLAANWTNLLPACGNCNTRQKQVMAETPPLQMVGKGNEFPIADERKRALKPGDEKRERPLLLNPFEIPVDQFLVFRTDGQVEPAKDAAGQPKPEAVASIKIYGLQRMALVRAREEAARRITAQLRRVASAYHNFKNAKTDPATGQTLSFEWGEMERAEADSSPYAGMARQLFRTIPANVRKEIITAVKKVRAQNPGGFAVGDLNDLFSGAGEQSRES